MKNENDINEYCRNKVNEEDQSRYMTIILTPSEFHNRLFALAAFNIEMAHCVSRTSESMMSIIKLQWWKDAIKAATPENDNQDVKVEEHPVLQALIVNGLFEDDDIRNGLISLIDNRQDYLELNDDVTFKSILVYGQRTSGLLLTLMSKSMGIRDKNILKSSDNIGIALALLDYLKAVCFQGPSNPLIIPGGKSISKDKIEQKIQEVGANLSDNIKAYLTTSRSLNAKVTKPISGLFQLASYIEETLVEIEKASFNREQIKLPANGFAILWKTFWKSKLGRF